MKINEITYIGSFPRETLCPKDGKPEFAFIGRSNVGKSSLINMLAERKNIARTSKKPGKTQALNYYLVNKSWYIVDLPGYGYASISKGKRKQWRRMIDNYFQQREVLQCAFILIDANIPPQKNDIEFINWLGLIRVPFVLVFTKTDRMTLNIRNQNIEKIKKELLKHWEELPQQFITSAEKNTGREEILGFIEDINC